MASKEVPSAATVAVAVAGDPCSPPLVFNFSRFQVTSFSFLLPPQVRELYTTFRNFQKRVVDFLRFRQVTARLDRFADATPEDLERCDGICIICREEMAGPPAAAPGVAGGGAAAAPAPAIAPAGGGGSSKKLPCGHVFHVHCLR